MVRYLVDGRFIWSIYHNENVILIDAHKFVVANFEWTFRLVQYFQNMLETKSTFFLLAEIAVEVRKDDSSVDWSTVVKALETLEETDQDNGLQFPSKLKILAALQQDAVDMLQIPRENTAKLQKFL